MSVHVPIIYLAGTSPLAKPPAGTDRASCAVAPYHETSPIGISDWEPCRIKHGCYLLARGAVCADLCWARLSER